MRSRCATATPHHIGKRQSLRDFTGPPPEAWGSIPAGIWGATVDDATFASARARVRERLRAAADDTVRWPERKSFSGSEFFNLRPAGAGARSPRGDDALDGEGVVAAAVAKAHS